MTDHNEQGIHLPDPDAYSLGYPDAPYPPDAGGLTLSAREVVTLLYLLDGVGDDAAVAQVFTTQATVTISTERARVIRSKMMTRLRMAGGQGPFGEVVRENYKAARSGRPTGGAR